LFHHKEPIWQPTCAKVYTRHVLVKKELTKEVCGWKWEVVDLCPHCSSCCSQHAAAQPKGTQPNTVQSQAVAANATDDYYGQNEAPKPVAQPVDPAANSQKADLVSHNAPSKLKSLLLPMLAK
jgi:hypothetical protein